MFMRPTDPGLSSFPTPAAFGYVTLGKRLTFSGLCFLIYTMERVNPPHEWHGVGTVSTWHPDHVDQVPTSALGRWPSLSPGPFRLHLSQSLQVKPKCEVNLLLKTLILAPHLPFVPVP